MAEARGLRVALVAAIAGTGNCVRPAPPPGRVSGTVFYILGNGSEQGEGILALIHTRLFRRPIQLPRSELSRILKALERWPKGSAPAGFVPFPL